MKILLANIALGLQYMDQLAANLKGHATYHSWSSFLVAMLCPPLRGRWGGPAYSAKRIEYLRRHENLNAILSVIAETNPDIVVLNEVVPEVHRSRLDDALKTLGFTTLSYGLGGKYPDAHASTLVATKEQGQVISVAMPQLPYPGCGGGIAGLRLNSGISVIGAHMALGGTSLWPQQLASLEAAIKNEQASGNKIVFAGDCNETEKHITPGFSKLGLVSADKNKTPTCPTSLPRAFWKSIDHIYLPRTWKTKNSQTISFGSDHLALHIEASPTEY